MMTDKAFSILSLDQALYYLCHTQNQEQLYSLIKSNPNLTFEETETINRLDYLYKQVGSFPTYDLLMTHQVILPQNLPLYDDKTNEQQVNLFVAQCDERPLRDKLSEACKLICAEGVTNRTQEAISELSNLNITNTEDKYEDYLDKYEEVYNSTATDMGISLIVQDYDKKTGGIHAGELATVVGYAGSGKSTYALNLAYKAIRDKFNVLYVSLEMTKYDLITNLLCCHTYWGDGLKPMETDQIRKKQLSDEQKEYLFRTVLPQIKECEGKLYLFDETDLSVHTTNGFERKFKQIDDLAVEETEHGLDLVVIDHAQLLKFSDNSKLDSNTVINRYVSFFRQQCINFCHTKRQCSFLVLSQANRDGWLYATKHQGMYRLTALADANELERASSLVISVFTDEGLKSADRAMVALLKSRNSETSVLAEETEVLFRYRAMGEIDKREYGYSGSMDDIYSNNSHEISESICGSDKSNDELYKLINDI